MTTFKEFAIGKFVLRFYKTDHVWTCTMTENMLDEVSKELALQRLSDIGQTIERELTDEEIYAEMIKCIDSPEDGHTFKYKNFARAILKKASEK